MKRLCVLVMFGLLASANVALADNGGVEWVGEFQGPGPFWGYAFEFRGFAVRDEQAAATRRVPKIFPAVSDLDPDIRWLFVIKGGIYTSGDKLRFDDLTDTRSVHMVSVVPKLMYRVSNMLDVGGGVGFLWLSGGGFPVTTRGQVPFEAAVTPLASVIKGKWGRVLRARVGEVFTFPGLTGADLQSTSSFSMGPELHFAWSIVADWGVLRGEP